MVLLRANPRLYSWSPTRWVWADTLSHQGWWCSQAGQCCWAQLSSLPGTMEGPHLPHGLGLTLGHPGAQRVCPRKFPADHYLLYPTELSQREQCMGILEAGLSFQITRESSVACLALYPHKLSWPQPHQPGRNEDSLKIFLCLSTYQITETINTK